MFGIEEILSWIRRQVGLRTDTADAAGSLHASLPSSICTSTSRYTVSFRPMTVVCATAETALHTISLPASL